MLSFRSAQAFKYAEIKTERLTVLDKIQKELLSIPSYDLSKTLNILHKNFNASTSKLYISDNNEIIKLHTQISENNIVELKNEILFENEKISEQEKIENSNDSKQIKITSSIYEKNKLKAILYFEKEKTEEFDSKLIEVLKLLKSQITNIIDNSKVYIELENLNKNLEQKVLERTQEVIEQKEEIENKNIELSEIIEELKVTNEIIKSKNAELEKQKIEIIEKHEELLQQQEEILSINEILEKRQEEILQINTELEAQKTEISNKNEHITNSIE